MSKYTTEVRSICEELSGFGGGGGYADVNTIIELAIPKIFNFSFPIFDDNYKNVLLKKILKHYYTREIGEETVGLWRLRLDTRLNEIMPYYNKLYNSELLEFNPLYNVSYTKTGNRNGNNDKNESEKIVDDGTTRNSGSITNVENGSIVIDNTGTVVTDGTNTGTVVTDGTNTGTVVTDGSSDSTSNETAENSSNRKDLYSDTPQGSVSRLDDNTYLTNARDISDSGDATRENTTVASNNETVTNNLADNHTVTNNLADNHTVTNDLQNTENRDITNTTTNDLTNKNDSERNRGLTSNISSTEDYVESIIGYNGINGSEMLIKFRETFLNIDMLVIRDLDDLFIQLW